MSAWIKRNPFSTDPKMEMISFVAEMAQRTEAPLTADEQSLLATENPEVDPDTEHRLRSLVSAVIADQKQSGREDDPKSFLNAIEWVGDAGYPYVLALALAELTGSKIVEKHERREISGPTLAFGCFAVLLVVVVIVVLIVRALS